MKRAMNEAKRRVFYTKYARTLSTNMEAEMEAGAKVLAEMDPTELNKLIAETIGLRNSILGRCDNIATGNVAATKVNESELKEMESKLLLLLNESAGRVLEEIKRNRERERLNSQLKPLPMKITK